jgi:hypothetical protein
LVSAPERNRATKPPYRRWASIPQANHPTARPPATPATGHHRRQAAYAKGAAKSGSAAAVVSVGLIRDAAANATAIAAATAAPPDRLAARQKQPTPATRMKASHRFG